MSSNSWQQIIRLQNTHTYESKYGSESDSMKKVKQQNNPN